MNNQSVISISLLIIILSERAASTSAHGVGYKCSHARNIAYVPINSNWVCDQATTVKQEGDTELVQVILRRPVFFLEAIRCTHLTKTTKRYCSFGRYPEPELIPENLGGPSPIKLSFETCNRYIASQMWEDPTGNMHSLASGSSHVILGKNLNGKGWCISKSTEFLTVEHTVTLENVSITTGDINGTGEINAISHDNRPLRILSHDFATDHMSSYVLTNKNDSRNAPYAQLAYGNMTRYKYSDGTTVLSYEGHHAAFIIGNESVVQGITITSTHLPNIYLVRDNILQSASSPVKQDLSLIDLVMADMTSLEVKMIRLFGKSIAVQSDLVCNLAEAIQRQLAHLHKIPGSLVARAITGRDGFTAQLVGEAIAIAQCVPYDWKIRPSDVCYNRIPISFSSHQVEGFLDATSKEIWHHANIIDCDDLSIPVIRINGSLVSMKPYLQKVGPMILSPATHLSNEIPESISSNFLYTRSQLEELRHASSYKERLDRAMYSIVTKVSRAKDQEDLSMMSGDFLDSLSEVMWDLGLGAHGKMIAYSVLCTGLLIPAVITLAIFWKICSVIFSLTRPKVVEVRNAHRQRPIDDQALNRPNQGIVTRPTPDSSFDADRGVNQQLLSPAFLKMVSSRSKVDSPSAHPHSDLTDSE